MPKKLTQDEFLIKVTKENRNDIDYSDFIYNGNNKIGTCKCNVCGYVWETVPMSLFKGHGCPKCAVEKKARVISKNVLDVIHDFREVHGDKYDYSKIEYVNNKTPIEIICPEHGSFFQKPMNHLRGHGCPKCSKTGVKLSQEEFEERVRLNNPNLDVSCFSYVNSHRKSVCKCKVCGYVWKTSQMLLNDSNYSCPNCSRKKRVEKRTYSLEEFLGKYAEINKSSHYDFSKSVYINSSTKMTVTCPKHGDFEIRPNDLLHGHGCPKCNISRLEKDVSEFLHENGIHYVQYATFEWLVNEKTNRKLTFDFFLPEYKIAIECQGEQHFVPIEHFGGVEKFEVNKERDELKRELARKNGIEVVYYQDNKYNGLIKHDLQEINEVNKLLKIINDKKKRYEFRKS